MGLVFGIVGTRGRRTGRTRHNLVTYRRVGGRVFLLGLYGRESHWYRNLTADPLVTFQDALSTRPMLARPLTDDADVADAHAVLRHGSPIVYRAFYLWALGIHDDPADLHAQRDRLALVELTPASGADDAERGRAPRPVRMDLIWVWAIALLAWLLRRRAR